MRLIALLCLSALLQGCATKPMEKSWQRTAKLCAYHLLKGTMVAGGIGRPKVREMCQETNETKEDPL